MLTVIKPTYFVRWSTASVNEKLSDHYCLMHFKLEQQRDILEIVSYSGYLYSTHAVRAWPGKHMHIKLYNLCASFLMTA